MQTVKMRDINPALPDSMKVGQEGLLGEDGVVPGAELDLAARSVIDSTYIVDIPVDTTAELVDSAYMISKDKEVNLLKYEMPDSLVYDEASGKYVVQTPEYRVQQVRFNVEQDNYMWYLRKNLVLPDVRAAQNMQAAEKAAEKKEKKGISGFFKKLFKKKRDSDSTDTAPVKAAGEFDYVDDNEGAPDTTDVKVAPEKKKSSVSFLKRKKRKDITEPKTAGGKSEKKKKEKKKKKKDPQDITKPEEKEEEDDDGF